MSRSYSFRPPTPLDAPAISALIGTVWSHFFAYSVSSSDLSGYLAGPLSPASIERDIASPSERFLVATDTTSQQYDGIVGVLQLAKGMTEPCLSSAKSIHLRRFYVDMAYHGTGLAADLMAQAETMARGEGYESIWLGVWEGNKRGERFYEKMGFEERGEKSFIMGGSDRRDLVLEKRV